MRGLATADVGVPRHRLSRARIAAPEKNCHLEIRRIPRLGDNLDGLLVAYLTGRNGHSCARAFGRHAFDYLASQRFGLQALPTGLRLRAARTPAGTRRGVLFLRRLSGRAVPAKPAAAAPPPGRAGSG